MIYSLPNGTSNKKKNILEYVLFFKAAHNPQRLLVKRGVAH
jgi:hypothetical protein